MSRVPSAGGISPGAVRGAGDGLDEGPLRLGELRLELGLAFVDRAQQARIGRSGLQFELHGDQDLIALLLQRDQCVNPMHMPVTLEKAAYRAACPG